MKNVLITALIILLPAISSAKEGLPTVRVITVYASSVGVLGHGFAIKEARERVDQFAQRTRELGGKTTVRANEYISAINLDKTADQDLAKYVVEQTQGCLKFDDLCKEVIRSFNRGLPDAAFEPDYVGELTVPVKNIMFMIYAEYGDKFRVKENGLNKIYYAARSIQDSLTPLKPYVQSTPAMSMFVDGEGQPRHFDLIIENED